MFVDIRSLLSQSIKVAEGTALPELDWSYIIEVDYPPYSIKITLSLTSDETEIVGQKRTTSINEITPTSFKNSFHVPSFVWRSPKAAFKIIDNYFDDFLVHENFYLGLNDFTLNTSANYEFVPEVGIQISNLSIEFDIGYLRANIENIYRFFDGETEEYGPSKYDYAGDILSDWKLYEKDYTESLQFRINCVLSESRNNPTRCGLEGGDYYVNKDYYKMNVLQLIQTIGLGSLDRY